MPSLKRKDPSYRPFQRTTRLEAFSDGVFAIAITLLVLEISVEPEAGQGLGEALLDQWASYLAYAASFFTIGALWLAHSTISEYLARADPILLRINLVLLFGVGFLPFPTTLIAEYIDSEGAERVAVTLYGILLTALLLVTSVLWRYALGAGLVRDDVSPAEIAELTKRLSPTVLLYFGAIVLGLVFPVLAVVAYLSIAVLVLIPVATVYRVVRPKDASGNAAAT
jgi:uncharacterized membrane protein